MEKLDNFKLFVKKNPILLKYIKNNEMTWQKFYEIYDMYGEEDTAWHDYIETGNTENVALDAAKTGVSIASIGELFKFFKGINLDNVQEGIQSIQRVVGMVGDLSNKNSTSTTDYKPRPLYKHFDD